MADRGGISKAAVDRACGLYKKFLSASASVPKQKDSVAAAALYLADRMENHPRTFKEIVGVSHSSKKEVSRAYKQLLKYCDPVAKVTTDDFVERFCANLGLTRRVQTAAAVIARRAVALDVAAGRSPVSVTAAAIYMASQTTTSEKKTQKEISAVAGVADVTIRHSYKLLYSEASSLFPNDFVFEVPIQRLPLS